jgi:hypothetical protein
MLGAEWARCSGKVDMKEWNSLVRAASMVAMATLDFKKLSAEYGMKGVVAAEDIPHAPAVFRRRRWRLRRSVEVLGVTRSLMHVLFRRDEIRVGSWQ